MYIIYIYIDVHYKMVFCVAVAIDLIVAHIWDIIKQGTQRAIGTHQRRASSGSDTLSR